MERRGENEQPGAAGFGLLLDRLSSTTCLRGRFPANAIGNDSPRGRRPPADSQHVHLAALHPALLEQGGPPTQAAAGDQNEKLWIRVNDNVSERERAKRH